MGGVNQKVEWRTLESLCYIVDYRGKTPRKTDTGIFLVTAKNIRKGYIDYNCSKEYISADDYDEVMHRGLPQIGDVLITTEAPLGNVAQIDNDTIALAQRVIKYRPKDNTELSSGFLKHYLLGSEFQNRLYVASTGGTVKGIKGSRLHQLTIPVPPLEVQQRIVNVLDNFEAICSDLQIGLPAEMEARKKQYEYYRDLLLSFDNSQFVNVERERERERERDGEEVAQVQYADVVKLLQYVYGVVSVSLERLFETRNVYTPSKTNVDFWEGKAEIPWFRMDDIRDNGRILYDSLQHITKKALKGETFPAESIIISTSATIGEHALIKVPSVANQRFTYLILRNEFKTIVDINYLFYYCFKLSTFCKEHLNQSSFASVDMGAFKEFMFCIPSLEEQKRIVDILDRFDTLCNDITKGLPAEIEARQRQYEYYRDNLLNFMEG